MLRNKNPPCFLVRMQERHPKKYIKKAKCKKKLCNVVCFLVVDVLECSAMVELQKPEKILLNHHFGKNKQYVGSVGSFLPGCVCEGVLFTSFLGVFPRVSPASVMPSNEATTLFQAS